MERKMKKCWFAAFGAVLGLAVLMVACGDDEACSTGDKKCSGEQIQACTDGIWGEVEDCPTGQSCMDMPGNSEDHCMAGDMQMD